MYFYPVIYDVFWSKIILTRNTIHSSSLRHYVSKNFIDVFIDEFIECGHRFILSILKIL